MHLKENIHLRTKTLLRKLTAGAKLVLSNDCTYLKRSVKYCMIISDGASEFTHLLNKTNKTNDHI